MRDQSLKHISFRCEHKISDIGCKHSSGQEVITYQQSKNIYIRLFECSG